MKKMKALIEGYGCSHNLSDTEKLKFFVKENGFELTPSTSNANIIILNGCGVKKVTENRMLNRIKKLFLLTKNSNTELIVFGCLTSICPTEIQKISKEILLAKDLKELSNCLKLQTSTKNFSPEMPEVRTNKFISILPIANGCLSSCYYCTVKNARGKLRSHSINSLNKKFQQLINETNEIWLCAEDTGCYGADINSSLPELLQTLLQNKGNHRIRIGMMNPQWVKKYSKELIEILKYKNVYKFLHIPVQSGSNRILKKMNRSYTVEEFTQAVKKPRKEIPEITLSTDVIAGFPGETEEDFQETIAAIKELKPDIVNISRYDNRPKTKAASFQNQLHGREKKKRSRILTNLCQEISLKKNEKLLGKEFEILFTEKGKNNSFVGRTISYKPVVIKNPPKNLLGKFLTVEIIQAKPTYLVGKLC